MPERQSSPGEATPQPDKGAADGTTQSPPEGETVAEQVAAQVAHDSEAVEPGPVAPADKPAADAPVVAGAEVVEQANEDVAEQTAQDEAPEMAPEKAPQKGPQKGPAKSPEKGPNRKAPAIPATVVMPAGAPTKQPGKQPGQQARPRPRPRQGQPVADESPTTMAPSVASAASAQATQHLDLAKAAGEQQQSRPAPAQQAKPAAKSRPQPGNTEQKVPGQKMPGQKVPGPNATGSTWFAGSDAERTQVLPRSPAGPPAAPSPSPANPPGPKPAAATSAVAHSTAPHSPSSRPGPADPPTERIQMREQPTMVAPREAPPQDPPVGRPPGGGGGGGGGDEGGGAQRPRRLKRSLLVVGGVLAALVVGYGADLLLGSGSVPRGVTVAGVALGGLNTNEAERQLRAEVEPRTTQPIAVAVGEATAELDPARTGLTVDWAATMAEASAQPLNPITRITSFFTERPVGVVTTADEEALNGALGELEPIVAKAPVEGSVKFAGTIPQEIDPVAGQQLDIPAAGVVLRDHWVDGGPVALPLVVLEPTTSIADVTAAIDRVAKPAVAASVTVVGEKDTKGSLTPTVIAGALSFRPDPAGGLVAELNPTLLEEALSPALSASEQAGRDASLDFSTGAPVVVPSQDGRGVDYEATAKLLIPVLSAPTPRQIMAVYAEQPAELTTEELNALGITGVIGEFTTGGFAADSGRNIKRAAEQINGKIVQPGETFSLNAVTNPRNAANGYVEAGIISEGHPSRGIGGGVSQVATTLYNASYLAGMVNVEHKEHSFYISRYPAGREATVFDDLIDLKFRNDNPTGVMIQTVWTPTSLTIRIYGTKRYEVTGTTGPRHDPTDPNTVTIPEGEPCSTSEGAPGFTVTDTRTLREISTGQVRTEERTVRYNPSPKVICGG
ncbi:VanW family protein [Pseudonocardia sp. TRM90224]|uniref:VanW family protein n=1 Tax=Pseudonocardia sp. TRM90224 TaxID=2812678 RepID=UPI001E6175C9|nr:VanW family protein [Pseudonocardia sp. TRM90224]